MRVILLSAGKGTRLYPLTQDLPKCLLPVKDNKTVIDYQMEAFLDVGIKDIIIVVGYMAEKIEKYLSYKDYFSKLNIELVYNPFYDVSNNLVSLWMAKCFMNEEFISINGDDIFHPSVLEGLINEKKGDIVLTISRKQEYDLDDMKVITVDDRVVRIGKDIGLKEANGESVGIIRYTQSGANIMKGKLGEMVKSKENLSTFYLSAIQSLIDDGYIINFHEIPSDKWAEIDFHIDLEFVRRNYEKFTKSIENIED